LSPLRKLLRDHSLTIFLVITGVGWVVLYAYMNSEAKWGQVVGKIVSEWSEIFRWLRLRKLLIEPQSNQNSPGHK